MSDVVLLMLLEALLIIGAVLRILLEKKRGGEMSPGWKLQSFLFPILLLAAILLWRVTGRDYLMAAIFLGILEELICGAVRKRRGKKPEE